MVVIGEKVKEIRIRKGFSQEYIARDICTQGNYSKFEKGYNKDIKNDILHKFLNRLELTYEEFNFIYNDYKLTLKEEIVSKFQNQQYNNVDDLLSLQQLCQSYLKEYPDDKYIGKISIIIKGLNLLADNNYHGAQTIVKPIWEELSLRNDLYFSDIFLLNSILFIFPIDTAVEMKNFAFRSISKYNNFYNINRIKINFLVNISLLNIKNKYFKQALVNIDEAINLSKLDQQFINLSICYVRKGICLNNLKKDGGGWINKGLNTLEVLDKYELLEVLKSEVSKYSH